MDIRDLAPWGRVRGVSAPRGREDPFFSLHREMNRMFENFGRSIYFGPWSSWDSEGFHPRTDVRETDDGVLVTAEMPGLEEKDFEVTPIEEREMKIRPLHDRILVKRIEEEAKSKGGIIIPDTAKEKPQEGKVIAVGKGKVNDDGELRPLDVHKGDRILFGKYSGSEIQLEGEEHLIIREDDVLAVLE